MPTKVISEHAALLGIVYCDFLQLFVALILIISNSTPSSTSRTNLIIKPSFEVYALDFQIQIQQAASANHRLKQLKTALILVSLSSFIKSTNIMHPISLYVLLKRWCIGMLEIFSEKQCLRLTVKYLGGKKFHKLSCSNSGILLQYHISSQ